MNFLGPFFWFTWDYGSGSLPFVPELAEDREWQIDFSNRAWDSLTHVVYVKPSMEFTVFLRTRAVPLNDPTILEG